MQPRPGAICDWRYEGDNAVVLDKGAEMGRFLLGSTVVLLFAARPLSFNTQWTPGGAVQMGEAMAAVG